MTGQCTAKPSEVTIQGLAHALFQTTGKKLEDFRCPLSLGEFSSFKQKLDPLASRPILVTLTDEERCQFRALNLLFGVLKIRGLPQSDYSHRAWNDVSLCLTRAGLKPAILKGTLLCSHYRGPYQSGKFGWDLQSVSRKLMLTCSDSFLDSLSIFQLISECCWVYFVWQLFVFVSRTRPGNEMFAA